MATSFANGTSVSVEKTRGEIEKMLQHRGASSFGTITELEHRRAIVGFKYKGLNIQMSIPLPDPKSRAFTDKKRGWGTNSDAKAYDLYDGEIRRRWRCLALALKSKLVACEDGITTFEKEFMPYVVLPNGETIGERLLPVLEHAIAHGGMVPMALALPEGGQE